MKIIKLLGILLLLTGASACKNDKKEKMTPLPPVKVSVRVVGEGSANGPAGRTFSGTVASSNNTMVSFPVSGTIASLTLSEGDRVNKGQVLGRLSAGDYENANNIAQAELAEAQDAYQRMKKLHDAEALPDIKWVEIQQKLKQAENAAQIARRTLSDVTLHSPLSGTVNRKMANVGQNVAPGEPIYEIVASGDLSVNISMSERETEQFKIGMPAVIRFNNSSLPEIESKITQISAVADPLTRTFTVKLALPSSDKIKPGILATVEFLSQPDEENISDGAEGSPDILLPPQAVQLSEDNRNFVWIVKQEKAERRFVEADELISNGVLVTGGLQRGDTVIVEGMSKIGTGTRVIPQIKQ